MNTLLHTHVCPAHRSVTSVVPPLQSLCVGPTVTPSSAPCHPHLCHSVPDGLPGCHLQLKTMRRAAR